MLIRTPPGYWIEEGQDKPAPKNSNRVRVWSMATGEFLRYERSKVYEVAKAMMATSKNLRDLDYKVAARRMNSQLTRGRTYGHSAIVGIRAEKIGRAVSNYLATK